jgi:hypothetical protein
MTTTKIWKGGKLLLALADFLENDPRVEGHFDMDTVLAAKGYDFYHTKNGKPDLQACGTAACAMGWAPMVPAIHRAGLSYIKLEHGDWYIALHGQVCGFVSAAAELFDIDSSDVAILFYSCPGHRTPEQVARNIRRFVVARAKRRK